MTDMDKEELIAFVKEARDASYWSVDNLLEKDYEARSYFNGFGDALQIVLSQLEQED